jgi:nucleoside-diphosphate-sugar epimerase
MPRIAVFGGNGYLASIIKNQNNTKKNSYTFFSRKKNNKNYINLLSSKKNLNILKNYHFIIHLAGPNQNQLKKNEKLIQKKNRITSRICDLCLANNIKLIYLSSMQVYKDYGIKDISINSKINLENLYSKSHYDSEKIIIAKFLNHKKKFTILRMGNVFGLNRYNSTRDIDSNLIHSFCYNALEKKNILINNGSIRRTFIPSQIFLNVISSIIKRNLFNNLIENISYKNLNLREIAYIIQKRIKLLFRFDVQVKIENFKYKKKYKIYSNKYLKFNFSNKMIYFEIDQILKCIKKNN